MKIASRFLNLKSVSSEREDGFLPTFGPDYIHFYSSNHLEGYLGKTLIYLETNLLSNNLELDNKPHPRLETTPIPIRDDFFQYENVVLFATIFEVSSINRKYSEKPISFRLSCGPVRPSDESGDKTTMSLSPPLRPKITNKNYSFLPIEENKPCLALTLPLPDLRKRMYNFNLLSKMSKELVGILGKVLKLFLLFYIIQKGRLLKIEEIFIKSGNHHKSDSWDGDHLIVECLDFLTSSAQKYIDITSNYSLSEESTLVQQRMKIALKEMVL